MKKRTSYAVDVGFPNAPSVQARAIVVDPVTKEEREMPFVFTDDDARDICEMVPNPDWNGEGDPKNGLIATGKIDLAKLDAKIVERIAAATTGAATAVERIEQAEEARRAQHAAEIAEEASRARKEALDKEIAAAERQLAERTAALATLPRIIKP